MSKSSEAKDLYESEERTMTEEDRIKVGNELADVDRQIIAIKEEKKNVNRAYRVRLNKLEERSDVLSKQWTDGVIEDSFEVLEVHDDERFMVQVTRKDNGRPVGGPRPMTEPEKAAAQKRKQGKLSGIVDDDYVPPDTDPGTPKAKRSKPKGKGSKR
jgi:hypothetical protein